MSAKNAGLRYRPLRAGIRVINGVTEQPGTIGFFGKSTDGRLWLVSCYHVLVRAQDWTGAAFAVGERIYQGKLQDQSIIAQMTNDRVDEDLDCAAAALIPGVSALPEVLGVGPIGQPTQATIGMRVMKYGSETGLTEGVIRDFDDSQIRIEPPTGFPAAYELSKAGDSGALWLEQGTRAPVGLHNMGEAAGTEFARATPIQSVLTSLDLAMWDGG